jgi:hypothetical protein
MGGQGEMFFAVYFIGCANNFRKCLKKPEWVLGTLLLISYGYFFHPEPLSNINSRMNMVRAVVEEGTFVIDKYHANTIDKAYYKGHYYSEKAIGTPFLAIPVYWTLQNVSALLRVSPDFSVFLYLITICTVSLPSSLLGVLIFRFTGELSPDLPLRLIVTLGYALGTISFPYATMFYEHQLFIPFLNGIPLKRRSLVYF